MMYVSLLVAVVVYVGWCGPADASDAVCNLQADPKSATPGVTGEIEFTQAREEDLLSIQVNISGLRLDYTGNHGFHVHGLGNTLGGCASTGGHYNPLGKKHGAPTDVERHVGDFGNLVQTAYGIIQTTFTDKVANLYGRYSIVGRAIVLHENKDDLGKGGNAGSEASGNAGSRLACCVIGWNKL